MKTPWIVTWWDINTDKARTLGVRTHEAALLLQAKLKHKGNNNVQVKTREHKR